MTKRQLIDEIRHYNITATPAFLLQFDEFALRQYLENLQDAANKRLKIHTWVKRQPKLRLVS